MAKSDINFGPTNKFRAVGDCVQSEMPPDYCAPAQRFCRADDECCLHSRVCSAVGNGAARDLLSATTVFLDLRFLFNEATVGRDMQLQSRI